MTTRQAVKFFGSKAAMARACKRTAQAVQNWGTRPPLDAQRDLEKASGGKLQADYLVKR